MKQSMGAKTMKFEKEIKNVRKNEEFREKVYSILKCGYPDYALALYGFEQVVAISGKVIGCTDYRNIYINEALNDDELSLVVRHEILHVLLRHRARRPKDCVGYNRLWNMAGDYELSHYYSVFDNQLMRYSELLRGGCFVDEDKQYENRTATQIYSLLKAEQEQKEEEEENNEQNQNGMGSGSCDDSENESESEIENDNDSNAENNADEESESENEDDNENNEEEGEEEGEGEGEEDEGEGEGEDEGEDEDNSLSYDDLDDDMTEEEEDELRERMKLAVNAGYEELTEDEKKEMENSEVIEGLGGSKECGIGVERERPEIDGAVRLKRNLHHYFIGQERADKDFSYRRSHKKYRQSPFIVKGRSNVIKPSKTIACYVDVSGSMTQDMVKKALEVVEGLKKIRNMEVVVKYFDHRILEEFKGGGGTDYENVLKDATKNGYTCIAIITDNDPREIKDVYEFEALWLVGIEHKSYEYSIAKMIDSRNHKVQDPHIRCKYYHFEEVLPDNC